MMDALFHRGPCRSHEASHFSQAPLLTARKALEQSHGGNQAPLPLLGGRWAVSESSARPSFPPLCGFLPDPPG